VDKEPKKHYNFSVTPDTLKSALQDIMTFEEYASINHSTPYTYELSNGDKSLHYFGARHTFDSDSSMLNQIKTSFERFQPDMVFIEGAIWTDEKAREISSMPSEEVVAKYGEPGFTLKLALEKGIYWHCPEPSAKEFFDYLSEQGFSKDEIFTWHLLYAARHYSKKEQELSFEEYAKPYIDYIKSGTNWPDFDFSPSRALELGEQIIGRPINLRTLDSEMPDLHNPIPSKNYSLINMIDAEWSNSRDKKIITDIAKALETNNRIFMVYGATHAVMEEPALRKLFESETSS
jgi:hypothetical protein